MDDKDAFQRAVETMKSDDSRSFKLRFAVAMGSMSKLSKDASAISSPAESEVEAFQMDEMPEQQQQTTLTLEGQGILIYDRATGEPSHVSSPNPELVVALLMSSDDVGCTPFRGAYRNHNRPRPSSGRIAWRWCGYVGAVSDMSCRAGCC